MTRERNELEPLPTILDRVREKLVEYGVVSVAAQDLVLPHLAVRHLKPGERLDPVDESSSWVAMVLEGVVRESYQMRDGRENTRRFIAAGALTGAPFEPEPIPLSIVAIQHTTLASLAWNDVRAMADASHEWQALVREALSRLYRGAIEREYRFISLTPSAHYELLRSELPWLEQSVPLYEIAAYLRVTPVHLSRIRRALARRRMP